MHPIHSLLKVDVSEPLLVKDLLQFDSCKRPPSIRDKV